MERNDSFIFNFVMFTKFFLDFMNKYSSQIEAFHEIGVINS